MSFLLAISHEDVLSRIAQSVLRMPQNTGCNYTGCNTGCNGYQLKDIPVTNNK